MQEEFRQNTRNGSSYKNDDEEDFSLATKVKNGKGNKFHSKYESGNDGKKCDMSRVKCIHSRVALTIFPRNTKWK